MSELSTTDSEVAVLSLLMHNTDLAYNLSGLRFFMFSSITNQVIFAEIEDMLSRNLVPDISLLISSLDAKGGLAKCGGKEYIEYIYNSTYAKENFNEYIDMVSKSHKSRSFQSLISSVKSGEITLDNIDDKIHTLKENLDGIESSSTGSQTSHISDGVDALYGEIMERAKEHPGVRGIPWGFKKVDDITGGKSDGDLWIVCGRPGSGKSAIACNGILNDGYAGNPTLLFSKEMNYSTLVERLISIDSGVPISDIRLGVLNQEKINRIRESLQVIRKMPIYLDTNFLMDDYYIESAVKKFVNSKGVKAVYVDYLQLIAERDENMTMTLGRISRMLKVYANGLNISVVALSQLNREVEHRDNKRPMMSDIKQAGTIEEDADLVIGLYRDEYYNKETKYPGLMEFIFLKNRNGPTGTVTLDFISETNKVKG
jgi:replicative DNA helicase